MARAVFLLTVVTLRMGFVGGAEVVVVVVEVVVEVVEVVVVLLLPIRLKMARLLRVVLAEARAMAVITLDIEGLWWVGM